MPKPTYKPKKVQKEQSFADYMKYMNPLLLMSKLSTKEAKKQIKAQLKNKTYKMTHNIEQKLLKQMSKCKRCKNNYTKK